MVAIRDLGIQEYARTWQAMQQFNQERTATTEDEIWFLQHPPVFTRGLNCKLDPKLNPGNLPVVDTDRGGQITYHGPGQLIAYLLFDLKRRQRGVRHFVNDIEQSIIDTLQEFGVYACRREGAPGVYVAERKIAALGIRIKRGASYHGLSLNLDMDTTPFLWIDPCGYEGLEVVNLCDLVPVSSLGSVQETLAKNLVRLLE